jgi:hypothetical protein
MMASNTNRSKRTNSKQDHRNENDHGGPSREYLDKINQLQSELESIKKSMTDAAESTLNSNEDEEHKNVYGRETDTIQDPEVDANPVLNETSPSTSLDETDEEAESIDPIPDPDDHDSDDLNEDEIEDEDDQDEDELDDSTYEDLISNSQSTSSDDAIILQREDSGAMKILDSLVYYEVKDWVNEKTGKPYNRAHLSQNPPKLVVRQHVSGDEDSDEDSMVTIVINRSLASTLADTFTNIRKTFDGEPLEKKKEPFSWSRVKKYFSDLWRYEPIKIVLAGLVILILISAIIYGMIVA